MFRSGVSAVWGRLHDKRYGGSISRLVGLEAMSLTLLPVRKTREVHRPYAILAVLQVLDVATTGWILHHFAGAEEANPLVDSLFSGVGLFAGLGILLAFKLAVVYTFWACQTGPKIALTIYSIVIINNALALFLWLVS